MVALSLILDQISLTEEPNLPANWSPVSTLLINNKLKQVNKDTGRGGGAAGHRETDLCPSPKFQTFHYLQNHSFQPQL